MRFFETFPANRSSMKVWAPTVNQITINEAKANNAENPSFWEAYFATDEDKREGLLESWVDPNPVETLSINENATHWYPVRMYLAVIMEAKSVPGKPRNTLLTKEHYEEMI